jgi:hypothetical protein
MSPRRRASRVSSSWRASRVSSSPNVPDTISRKPAPRSSAGATAYRPSKLAVASATTATATTESAVAGILTNAEASGFRTAAAIIPTEKQEDEHRFEWVEAANSEQSRGHQARQREEKANERITGEKEPSSAPLNAGRRKPEATEQLPFFYPCP